MKTRFAAGILVAVLMAAALGAHLSADARGARGEAEAQQAPPAPSQDPPPVIFRVEVNYVEVDAIVTDAQGNVVTNLTADDFEILEDGRPQKVTAFSLVNLPVERDLAPLFATAPVEPDVTDNVGTEGRIYLFVLDDLHIDPDRVKDVRDAARLFVERYFGANDLAAVSYISGRADDSQDFTGNRRLLLASIDKFSSRKPSSLLPIDEAERGFNARTMMTSLRKQTDFMAGVRGRRKAVLLFSPGISYDIFDVTSPGLFGSSVEGPASGRSGPITNTATAVLEESRNAVASATRGNVVIYGIDPRGLVTASDGNAISSTGNLAPVPLGGDPVPSEGVGPALRSQRLAAESLRVASADTGGFAVVNRNDFTGAFDRIVRENSTYYVMGYYPTNERRDGRFRRVEVRVKRPGLTVRARSGYIEPRGRPANAPAPAPLGDPVRAAINDAVASPLPVSGLPIRVVASPLRGTAPNATVPIVVEVDTRVLRFVERDGMLASRVDVSYVVTDSDAKIRGTDHHTATMRFKPDALEAARGGGFRFLTQVDLPPGRYQLRVAASAENGPTGSVIHDLEVPDFYRERVSMSGVVIGSASGAATPTSRPKDPFAALLAVAPVTNRTFDRGDILSIFAEFYESLSNAPPHMFDINTTLSRDGGTVVFEDFDSRSSSDLQGRTGGFDYRIDIPLGEYEPGVYVLRLEGRSRAGNVPAVSRQIQITIRGE